MSENLDQAIDRRLCIAPMLDWTDRHCRYFLRLISPSALLYTEMVTTGAILFGDRDKFLRFSPEESPVALQLGGSNPEELKQCADIAEQLGYNEINLNVGCPSDRVQKGKIGACLMAEPELVAESVSAMKQTVKIPVTVKCRIGIDDQDSYEFLAQFTQHIITAGCKTLIVHARKAWLTGLSPKQNREIPPLDYERVYQLKQDFPDLEIIINGGVTSASQVQSHLTYVDGVMIGREAYHNPFFLTAIEGTVFDTHRVFKERSAIVNAIIPYVQKHLDEGGRLHHITRHMLGLFHGQPNGKLWRRHLSTEAVKPNAGIDVLTAALDFVV